MHRKARLFGSTAAVLSTCQYLVFLSLDHSGTKTTSRLRIEQVELCTDNAAMIAWAGVLRFQRREGLGDPLDLPIEKKWPIDSIF
jgi:tRNA A37 threonylcarbamoyltransferase TsaD